MKLNQKIMENVKLEDSPEIANEYVVLIKSVEHMKLANKQMDNLYKKQQDKLNQQQEKINVLEKNISKTKKRYKKLNKMKGFVWGFHCYFRDFCRSYFYIVWRITDRISCSCPNGQW
jgi:hypothetical protein